MDIDSNPFSERENNVVKLLLQGKSNKQIAFELGISTRTVEFLLDNIYAKLGVTSRTEAVLKLSENRLEKSAGDEDRIQVKSAVEANSESNAGTLLSIQRNHNQAR
ncbi:HTH-type transcriptional regulator MalT [Thermoflexales bacterium]|nr:HTH-type transcriptional regulator MalT [Thermoflexales bacterium]